MVHILRSRFGVYKGFFSRNACRMREQLCHIDHPDPITRMPSGRSLVSILPRVNRLTLCLHLFQALADALRINRTIEILDLQSNPIGDEGVKAWWPQRGEFGGPSKFLRPRESMWSPQPKSRIIHQKLDHAHPHFHKTRPLTIQLQMMRKLTNNPTGTGF